MSYDHLKRLNQHTDSSIPPHGVPALALLMHYAAGTGVNTLTDGFAVAEALRAADPDGFELLATYGYDGERDFVASRVDSTQSFNRGLVVSTRFPVIQLDAAGEIRRIQYNEVFRMPSTIPFDVFPRWYAAFAKFVEMLHSPEFEIEIPMEKGVRAARHVPTSSKRQQTLPTLPLTTRSPSAPRAPALPADAQLARAARPRRRRRLVRSDGRRRHHHARGLLLAGAPPHARAARLRRHRAGGGARAAPPLSARARGAEPEEALLWSELI